MDPSLMMIGCPVTVERDSYPSWPDMKYPAKKVERIRSVDTSLHTFSSFPSRINTPSRSSSSSSIFSERPTQVDHNVSAPSLKTRQFPQARNNVDDTLTSSYLSASGNDSAADLFCPPIMATSPLSQHKDDEMSPLQQCIATFAEQDREYNPPFKIPASLSTNLESEERTPTNNRRPRRNRTNGRSPLATSKLSSSSSDDNLSTPFASNPSSFSSAVSTLSSVSPASGSSVLHETFSAKGYELTESEFDQVLELSAQQDDLEIEDDGDILTPASTRANGSSKQGMRTPKPRVVTFTSSSTRYMDYGTLNRTVSTEEFDQLIDDIASARLSACYSQGSDDSPTMLTQLNDIDTIMDSRTATGRGRSATSASAPPSLPTVVETDERTLPHSCDDFASSATSLENNVSTCSSRCSVHTIAPPDDNRSVHPSVKPNKFGRGRSFSDSLTESFKKKGEGVAKSARNQWFYVTLHMRLRTFQAKKLIKKTSFKQLFSRPSKADLKGTKPVL